ncbi:hypothetical protein HID58_013684 [Brassica napus]|uniref:Uncharacterized protein n=1 Tax=Brassica napus TaxID=3708 RepID=A0ABQ8E4M5_BRANA|nr:hypothetical protein HID58_013684 [Brassica napus]
MAIKSTTKSQITTGKSPVTMTIKFWETQNIVKAGASLGLELRPWNPTESLPSPPDSHKLRNQGYRSPRYRYFDPNRSDDLRYERYLLEKEITLTDEEKHRNSRICNMLFIETSHCLADFIFSLGNHSLQLSDRERIDVKLNFTSDLRIGSIEEIDTFKDSYNIIEVFEESEGRKHGECSLLDLATVLEIKKKLCEANSVSESHIPDSLLERLISGTIEFPPACAIVGSDQSCIREMRPGKELLLL